MTFKPMLACKRIDKPTFPLLLSPKLDGVRGTIVDGRLLSRWLKPFANKCTTDRYSLRALSGLDGEFIFGSPTASDVFRNTSRVLSSINGAPLVTFYVFDDYTAKGGFKARLQQAKQRVADFEQWHGMDIRVLEHLQVDDEMDLDYLEEQWVSEGYEGVMGRSPSGSYKFGRATEREGSLFKVKRFEDDEAVIVGIEEEMRNDNVAKVSELGTMKRSSHKANKTGKGTMGALKVRGTTGRFKGVEFNIGSGFTAAERAQEWPIGTLITYKHFPVGVKDKPRHPVYHRIRVGGL